MSGNLAVAKVAAQLVAGLGVSKIVGNIVKNNVPIITTTEKIVVNAGSIVLGSMLVEQSSNHIERVTNDLATWFEKRKADKETDQ